MGGWGQHTLWSAHAAVSWEARAPWVLLKLREQDASSKSRCSGLWPRCGRERRRACATALNVLKPLTRIT